MARRWGIVVAVVAVTLATLGIAAAVRLRPGSLAATSSETGFRLSLPEGWRRQPGQPDEPSTRFRAEHRGWFGLVPDAWVWVSRWPQGDQTAEDMRPGAPGLSVEGADWFTSRPATVDGRPTVAIRYERGLRGWGSLGATRTLEYRVLAYGHVFQIGISTWRSAPDEKAAHVLANFRLERPSGTRRVSDPTRRFSIDLPASFDVVKSTIPSAVLTANDASTYPFPHWLYVFRPKDQTIDAAVAAHATRNIEANGGRNVTRKPVALDGVDAVQLDFEFPNSREYTDHGAPASARDREIFLTGPSGVLILAVGRNDPASPVADSVVASFRLISGPKFGGAAPATANTVVR